LVSSEYAVEYLNVPHGAANGGHGLKRPLLQRYKQDSSSLRRRTSHLGHRTNSAYSAVVEALEEARDLELGTQARREL